MLNEFEEAHKATLGDDGAARAAAREVAEIAASEAARKADQTRGSIIAQSSVLRAAAAYDGEVVRLRDTPGGISALAIRLRRHWARINRRSDFRCAHCRRATRSRYLAGTMCITSRATSGGVSAAFADTIEYLRPKKLGFQAEATRELDVLRAIYGESNVQPEAGSAAQAWAGVAKSLADQFRAAGGVLGEGETWRLPNPFIDAAKARALGADRFKQLVRDNIDRADMRFSGHR